MFRQILYVQWLAVRPLLGLALAVSFALPFLVLRVVSFGASVEPDAAHRAMALLTFQAGAASIFPGVATSIGMLLALAGWNWDQRQGHVYALVLPLPRWLYVLQRMAAGLVLAAPPALALWLGGLVALAVGPELPAGLRAYPGDVAFRFFLATVVIYSLIFALGAGTARTMVRLALGLLGTVLVLNLIDSVLDGTSVVDAVRDALLSWPSPFSIFDGSWLLIDV